jgi:hypothetical protein
MAASLLDLLTREKELVDEINDIDKELQELADRQNKLIKDRRFIDNQLKSLHSVLAGYLEKNLIKLPNHNPSKHPEVNK